MTEQINFEISKFRKASIKKQIKKPIPGTAKVKAPILTTSLRDIVSPPSRLLDSSNPI